MSPSEQPAAQPPVEPNDPTGVAPAASPSGAEPQAEQATQPAAQPEQEELIERVETPIGSITGTLHRAPRYSNFMILGAIVGVLGALVLTAVFPENADFSQTQIFGFLLLATVAFGVALGASVALLLDRLYSRAAKAVVADRVGVHESRVFTTPDAASDTHMTDKDSE